MKSLSDRETDRQTDRQRETDRQTDRERHTDRQTDREVTGGQTNLFELFLARVPLFERTAAGTEEVVVVNGKR